jgi:hypothetical protein
MLHRLQQLDLSRSDQGIRGEIDSKANDGGRHSVPPKRHDIAAFSLGNGVLLRHVRRGQILQIAFSVVHDPTQLNRQGPDVGSQYRSAIFYADETQQHIAEAYISQLDRSHAFSRPIVTRLDPLTGFFPAEDYHQDYLIHNRNAAYIAMYDIPKIENFKRTFPELYSGRPVLASVR